MGSGALLVVNDIRILTYKTRIIVKGKGAAEGGSPIGLSLMDGVVATSYRAGRLLSGAWFLVEGIDANQQIYFILNRHLGA